MLRVAFLVLAILGREVWRSRDLEFRRSRALKVEGFRVLSSEFWRSEISRPEFSRPEIWRVSNSRSGSLEFCCSRTQRARNQRSGDHQKIIRRIRAETAKRGIGPSKQGAPGQREPGQYDPRQGGPRPGTLQDGSQTTDFASRRLELRDAQLAAAAGGGGGAY